MHPRQMLIAEDVPDSRFTTKCKLKFPARPRISFEVFILTT
jgi:hypothetical protein